MKIELDRTVLIETEPGDKRLFVLRRDFHFTIDGQHGYSEMGEVTDFASVPFNVDIAEPWILRAAVLHDLYCRYRGKPPHGPVLGKWETAWMFQSAMKTCGASLARRVAGFIGVSAWAMAHWNDLSNAVWTAELRTRKKLAKRLYDLQTGQTPTAS